jgi:hypothetical protein
MHAGGGVLALCALAGIGITAASRATRSGGDTSDVRVARRTRGAMSRDAVERTGPAGRAGLKYALEWTACVGKGQARALCGLLRRAADGVRAIHQVEKREKRQSKRGKRSRPHVILPSRIPFYVTYSTADEMKRESNYDAGADRALESTQ